MSIFSTHLELLAVDVKESDVYRQHHRAVKDGSDHKPVPGELPHALRVDRPCEEPCVERMRYSRTS